ncbi:MAG: CSLREA domain-containing protein, partial [Gaiellaceae bacterium]
MSGRTMAGSSMNAMQRACLLAVLPLLALPASASAVDITVNSTGDTAADDGTCTLREAIVAANTNTASGAMANECPAGAALDAIEFSSAFDGQLADTITLDSAIASISTDTDVVGGRCMTDALVAGPCVGVDGPAGGFGLTADFNGISISGIAATGSLTGIRAIDSSSGFTASNNWLGVRLDGTAGANNVGMFIDPDSNGATIGGTTAAGRNVFANNNNTGLDIEGADNAVVAGNYFGVGPDGTAAPTNDTPTQIEITGSTAGGGFTATGNVVGGTPSAGEATSQACDGPCNVIVRSTDGSSAGIDLNGDGPGLNEMPAGQTSIRGNYIGFDATGAGEPGNLNAGISIGGADQVTVGGPAAGDGNRITGASTGISGFGDDLTIQNNVIGLNFAQTAMSADPPSTFGILANVPAGSTATISGNRIARPALGGTGTIAVQNAGTGVADITGNTIGQGINGESLLGGATGIELSAGQGGHVVDANVVHNVGGNAILIDESNSNEITGNDIDGSGAAGISIVAGSSSNTVGGDITADANTISSSGGDAVEVVDDGSDDNRILQNTGAGNTGLFIDLGGDGLGNDASIGPNAGIQAPVIAFASATSASGTAEPGATVRAFRKASPANGEIDSFLGTATADGAGDWIVAYPALPDATNIGATQTQTSAGTSEMSVGQTPPAAGGGGGGGGGGDDDDDDGGGGG